MLVKETMERNIFEFVDIESLVPKNHTYLEKNRHSHRFQ